MRNYRDILAKTFFFTFTCTAVEYFSEYSTAVQVKVKKNVFDNISEYPREDAGGLSRE